jgi:hypothetical protein
MPGLVTVSYRPEKKLCAQNEEWEIDVCVWSDSATQLKEARRYLCVPFRLLGCRGKPDDLVRPGSSFDKLNHLLPPSAEV